MSDDRSYGLEAEKDFLDHLGTHAFKNQGQDYDAETFDLFRLKLLLLYIMANEESDRPLSVWGTDYAYRLAVNLVRKIQNPQLLLGGASFVQQNLKLLESNGGGK